MWLRPMSGWTWPSGAGDPFGSGVAGGAGIGQRRAGIGLAVRLDEHEPAGEDDRHDRDQPEDLTPMALEERPATRERRSGPWLDRARARALVGRAASRRRGLGRRLARRPVRGRATAARAGTGSIDVWVRCSQTCLEGGRRGQRRDGVTGWRAWPASGRGYPPGGLPCRGGFQAAGRRMGRGRIGGDDHRSPGRTDDRGCRPASGSSSSTRSGSWWSSACRSGSSSTWRSRLRSACPASS